MQTKGSRRVVFLIVMAVLAPLSLLYVALSPSNRTSLKDLLPQEIKIVRTLDGRTELAGMGGYNYGLFEIDETVATTIGHQGLDFLSSLNRGRDPKRRILNWGTDTCEIWPPEEKSSWKSRAVPDRKRFNKGQQSGPAFSAREYYGACIVVLPEARLVAVEWID